MIKNTFKSKVCQINPQQGLRWIEELPDIIAFCAKKWHLQDLKPVDNLSYNYILTGSQNSQPIILKLGLKTSTLEKEAEALRIFKQCNGVQLINTDLKKGALLLERVMPGFSLKTYFPEREQESLLIFSHLVKELHQTSLPRQSNFSTMEQWLSILEQDWEPLISYLPLARRLKKDLLHPSQSTVLLHGDLHHDNILFDGFCWKVIDPKGIIGPPIYELCNFILNPLDEMQQSPSCIAIISKRINFLSSALNFDLKRIYQWCYIYTALSACWSLEENQTIDYQIKIMCFLINKC